MDTSLLQILLGILFLSIVFLNLKKKNVLASFAYGLQSFVILVLLIISFWETKNMYILAVVVATLLIKVILAPLFFIRLIKKNALSFSVSTYLNVPLTLITIFILTSVAHSQKFAPLTNIIPEHNAVLSLALSSMFLSLFLIINRKGALSQILGILSLENSMLAFIILAGLEQSPGLQLGVMFNIFIWILIATVFVTMMYKHFGTLNVTSMKKLKE